MLNFGLKQGFLKTNAALSLDFIHREKQEVTCLHPTIVEKMLRHAQQNGPELLISFIVGFWAGLRSAEIDRLQFKICRPR